MWVALAVLVALLVGAALFDWQARRRGRADLADPGHWRAASEARRESRRQWFGGGRRFGP